MDLQRVSSIEDEHRIFATFAKASTPPDRFNTVISSLVVGEHFIHSYHFRFREWAMDSAVFLISITYSRRDNTSFLETSRTMGDDLGIIGIMQEHLTVSCTS